MSSVQKLGEPVIFFTITAVNSSLKSKVKTTTDIFKKILNSIKF